MLRVRTFFAVGLILIGQQAPAPQQTTGTGVIAGQVIDGTTGKALGGAVVTVALGALAPAGSYGAQPLPAAQARRGVAVVNADGRFVFRNLPAGSFSLAVTLEGYAAGASGRRRPGGPSRTFSLADGARLTDVVIPIWRLAAVTGMVRDDRGEPVVGVYVSAMRRVITAGREEFTFVGGGGESTDDRGFYRIGYLMPGAHLVSVRSATQTVAIAMVDAYRAAVTSGSTPAPNYGQTGTLMMPRSGLNMGEWQVSVSIGQPEPLPAPNGMLLIHPAVFYPGARTPADATVLDLAPAEIRTGVDLTLPLVRGVRVSGVVVGPEGPAPNHGVRLVPVADAGPVFDVPVAYGTTDAAGRFALLGVPPGSYVARAYRVSAPSLRAAPPAAGAPPITRAEMVNPPSGPRPPSLFAEIAMTVGTAHVDGLSLTLQPGARLSGRVAFEGATPPPPAARLQQIALTFGPLVGTTPGAAEVRVDADGRFATSGYPPGRYTLSNVTPPGPEWTLASVHVAGVDVTTQPLTLGDSDVTDVVVTFTDKAITLSGTVRAGAGAADTDATVILFPADTQGWIKTGMSSRRLVMTSTSATGDYQVRVPLPGEYLLIAVPPEVAPEVDAGFLKRYVAGAVKVSLALGDTKTQPLSVSRSR